MHIDDNFTEVVVKATGEKTHIPPHWLDNPLLAQPFELPPSARAAAAAEKQPKTPAATPATDKTPAAGD